MALSAAHRTGQRFGVNYLIDVLQGKNTERIQRFGHHRQSTFGIGTDLDSLRNGEGYFASSSPVGSWPWIRKVTADCG